MCTPYTIAKHHNLYRVEFWAGKRKKVTEEKKKKVMWCRRSHKIVLVIIDQLDKGSNKHLILHTRNIIAY